MKRASSAATLVKKEREDRREKSMTDPSSSAPTVRPFVSTELFRPSLQYPTYPYAEMLARTAERYPEQVALVFREAYLTYRELDALVNILGNALLNLGIRRGQRVCLFMTNCPEYVISWFAITRIGAVASPLNPSYKEREVAYQLVNSGAVALIVRANSCRWWRQYARKRQSYACSW